MTKTKRLLDRLNNFYTPKVGDVLVSRGGLRGKFIVVHCDNEKIVLFQVIGGVGSTIEEWQVDGTSLGDFELVDVGFSDFIFAGFGPTGRAHVLFKRDAGVVYVAGCRAFTSLAAAYAHWRERGPASRLNWAHKREMARIAFGKARALGWMKVKRQPPVKKKTGGPGRAGERR